MFKRRTVFILGAGASREANLPCGDDFVLKISSKLDMRIQHGKYAGGGDPALFGLLYTTYKREMNQYLQTAWLIRDGIHLSPSIDNFLELHRDNHRMLHLAKATIVSCILDAERDSKLSYDDSNTGNSINFPDLHATWFAKFMKLLAKNVPRNVAATMFDNVSFIVFNYDRCLEHFLHHAVRRLYGFGHQEAASICAKVDVDHPYGLVAPLRIESGSGINFGQRDVNWIELADNIKTFTEQTVDGDMLESIRAKIQAAECLIFLGCAFHEPNMIMLNPGDVKRRPIIYGTGWGFSEDDVGNIQHQIVTTFRPTNLYFRNLKCADLFDNFSRSLAG
jgi:hypothetical protein